MKDWKKVVIQSDATIRETIAVIDASALQIALVLDEAGRLLGTITDGDIRRGILKGLSLEDRADRIMNSGPVVGQVNQSRESVLLQMKNRSIRQMPVVDADGMLVGLEMLDQLLQPPLRHNPVVLMAGGLGSRLHPITKECPKPLIRLGNKPMLEIILERLISHGFHRFYISVNYKAAMIKEHFGSGQNWGVDIRYIEEDQALGTAGPLGRLDDLPDAPLLVMNGDILTQVNFEHLLDFHHEHNARATMCVRQYDFQVPYGVISLERHRLTDIREKPVQSFFVNAGIYAIDAEMLSLVPKNCRYDMPDFFKEIMAHRHETAAFPVLEYWLDIGRLDDLERAKLEYAEVFK